MRILLLACLFLTDFSISQAQEDTVKTFVTVETLPEPNGGWGKFYKFLSKEIQYPEGGFEKSTGDKVVLRFVVETDGSLSNIQVYPGTEKNTPLAMQVEAIRVVSQSPNWKPGMNNGEPVRVRYQIPIKFSQDDKKSKKRRKK